MLKWKEAHEQIQKETSEETNSDINNQELLGNRSEISKHLKSLKIHMR